MNSVDENFSFVFVIFRVFLCGLGVASHITADQTAEMQENRENHEMQGAIRIVRWGLVPQDAPGRHLRTG